MTYTRAFSFTLMFAQQKSRGSFRKEYEHVPMRQPADAALEASYNEQQRELNGIYGTLTRSASENSVSMRAGAKSVSESGSGSGGGFGKKIFGRGSFKRKHRSKVWCHALSRLPLSVFSRDEESAGGSRENIALRYNACLVR